MSHFYGRLDGQAGTATRRGSKSSGISATVRTWSGDLDVSIIHSERAQQDNATVRIRPEHGSAVALGTFNHKAVLDAITADDKRTRAAVDAVYAAFERLNRAANAHANRTN